MDLNKFEFASLLCMGDAVIQCHGIILAPCQVEETAKLLFG